MYEIKFENIGKITSGTLRLEPDLLNVKYGANGIGKSTISKAMILKRNDEDVELIRNHITKEEPRIEIPNEIEKVLIFNEGYVDKYLFKEDLINNSYELIIKNNEYESAINDINFRFEKLKEMLTTVEIESLVTQIDNFVKSFSWNKRTNKIKKSGAFFSGVKNGNPLKNISNDIVEYKDNINSLENHIWLDWFKRGYTEYLKDDKCPFCKEKLSKEFFSNANTILESFEIASVKKNTKTREIISGVSPLLSEEDKTKIDSLLKLETQPSVESFDFMKEIQKTLFNEKEKLIQIKLIDPVKLVNALEERELTEYFKSLYLNEELFSGLDDSLFVVIKEVNELLSELQNEISTVQKEIITLKVILEKNIKKNQKYINDFLKISGIPYEFRVKKIGENNFKSSLYPINLEDKVDVECLSYGEKNVIALILFSIEAKAKEYDLLILDDPVSSFDNNKKYAVLHYLFINKSSRFEGQTVLLFTHDYELLLDVMIKNKFSAINCKTDFVSTNKGIYSEKRIKREDMINTIENWKSISLNEEVNPISRIINLRKYYECYEKDDNVWDVLSSLLHLSELPTQKLNHTDIRKLDEEEVDLATNKIKQYIKDFSYYDYYQMFTDNKNLKEWYCNSSDSCEKLNILRVILWNNKTTYPTDEDILFDFICETYHIENNMILSLSSEFNVVPEYVMNLCNEIVNKILCFK